MILDFDDRFIGRYNTYSSIEAGGTLLKPDISKNGVSIFHSTTGSDLGIT